MTFKNSRNVLGKFNRKYVLILYNLGIYLKIEYKQSFGFYPRSDFLYLKHKMNDFAINIANFHSSL